MFTQEELNSLKTIITRGQYRGDEVTAAALLLQKINTLIVPKVEKAEKEEKKEAQKAE